MVNKIRIIDLLNKIANGEEMPKKIKFNDYEYLYHDKEHGYCRNDYDCTYICLDSEYYLFDILNDEVEILEEPKEELEEIELIDNRVAFETINLEKDISIEHKWDYTDVIQNTKINELIANQNKIIRELKANKENE